MNKFSLDFNILREALDIEENPEAVKKLMEKLNNNEPLTDADLKDLSPKDKEQLRINLRGRSFELGECEKDDDTGPGADAILNTDTDKLKEDLKKINTASVDPNLISLERKLQKK